MKFNENLPDPASAFLAFDRLLEMCEKMMTRAEVSYGNYARKLVGLPPSNGDPYYFEEVQMRQLETQMDGIKQAIDRWTAARNFYEGKLS